MVSGVDTPTTQSQLVEASTNVALINQARQGAVVNSSQLVVGKQFQAEVVAQLTDGTYVVKIADIAARMQLPNSPEIGSKMAMTLISTSPRATFLLNPGEQDAANPTPVTTTATLAATVRQLIDEPASGPTTQTGAGSATGLYLQPGTAVTATEGDAGPRLITVPAAAPDGTPATFSSAARLVNQLVQQAPQQTTAASVARVPLLATPDTNVNTMMAALKNGVSSSGMFYESHLLQWAEGSLPTAQLMQEPQAQFPAPATQPAAPPASSADPAAAGDATRSAALAGSGAPDPTPITLPHDAAPIIQQQLQTMEQQRFMWHGELWPGQTMDWEIAQYKDNKDDKDDSNSGATGQETTWHSAVRFELPRLGAVSAQLQLTGNRLRLQISTDNPASAAQLQQHAPELASALEAAGTKLDGVLIRRHEQT